MDDLQDALAKDFDDIFTRLEKEIPAEVAHVIISGKDGGPRKSL